ncbi:MAG: hypothetical protein KAS32_21730 [Candidatus Peribacteraceae bacterium]|nr:hypothetical protein [Candidatus Peribacteraceae bacterium]
MNMIDWKYEGERSVSIVEDCGERLEVRTEFFLGNVAVDSIIAECPKCHTEYPYNTWDHQRNMCMDCSHNIGE